MARDAPATSGHSASAKACASVWRRPMASGPRLRKRQAPSQTTGGRSLGWVKTSRLKPRPQRSARSGSPDIKIGSFGAVGSPLGRLRSPRGSLTSFGPGRSKLRRFSRHFAAPTRCAKYPAKARTTSAPRRAASISIRVGFFTKRRASRSRLSEGRHRKTLAYPALAELGNSMRGAPQFHESLP